MLPFDLRSAPKIFTTVADALKWCIAAQSVKHIIHYLNDFAVMDPVCHTWKSVQEFINTKSSLQ